MEIQIWSDIMCPFCYIGKRRMEGALRQLDLTDEVTIVWKSFLLNPDMKTDPTRNSLEYLAETKGWTKEQTQEMVQNVVDMAKEEGLEYSMDDTKVANAMDAHRLIQLAKTVGKGGDMEERLFRAYFMEGKNIADMDVLVDLGKDVGIDGERVRECLEKGEFSDSIRQDILEAQQIGVRGVPFFVFNNQYAISGAQPLELFVQTMEKCLEGIK
ncbi:DsbA family oxidoreductase [Lunatibacter salilacus]|uniref:DsbA family oxidoreductase n=1 Tax=Lunatibacter salilacus TaxID=2483804 RepID=UPI00131ABE3B|nr:DsbA family oxidoreductase [Lunatibacter salilacus]